MLLQEGDTTDVNQGIVDFTNDGVGKYALFGKNLNIISEHAWALVFWYNRHDMPSDMSVKDANVHIFILLL